MVEQRAMSFRIERGLFKFDFTDYHAILGVPLDAEAKDVRKQYLKIARRLHPDSCKAENDAEKQKASQLLSKLVNPAYERLFADKNRAEYSVMLGRMGKRFAGEAESIQPQSEAAKQLFQSAGNIDLAYKTALQSLVQKHYATIDQVLEMTAQISELNMVYLMRKESKGESVRVPAKTGGGTTTGATSADKTGTGQTAAKTTAATDGGTSSRVEPYFRRAEELMTKNQFAKAEIELRDALKIEPSNSRCHSLLGMNYLKQNKTTMAKVHITQALKINPQDPVAQEGKQLLDKLTQQVGGSKTTTPPKSTSAQSKPPQGKPDDKSGGGLFGGLFGGKKK